MLTSANGLSPGKRPRWTAAPADEGRRNAEQQMMMAEDSYMQARATIASAAATSVAATASGGDGSGAVLGQEQTGSRQGSFAWRPNQQQQQ
mmetsp:Transcript_13107/g.35868  ORF Transcript_13107/g.35868 Transcript_13107/m.35868 type:complete len:91 (+) Transcript_13107:93-365(+)